MKTLKIHSELQTLLPALSDAEYKGLEADILEHGCLSPLVTWDDHVVDGHNRYAICQDHELPFETIELKFDSLEDAKFWAWSQQEHRRNLTPLQRSEIALKFKPMLAAKGKANMSAGGGDKVSTNAKAGYPTLDNPVTNTKKELALIAGVSHGTLHKAEYLCDHADDETKDKLRSGETSINKEYTRLRVAKEGETPDFDPEPMTPTYPNGVGSYERSLNLQNIKLDDTESLVISLFGFFDASYRERLIYDVLEKAHERDGEETVRRIVSTLYQKYFS